MWRTCKEWNKNNNNNQQEKESLPNCDFAVLADHRIKLKENKKKKKNTKTLLGN